VGEGERRLSSGARRVACGVRSRDAAYRGPFYDIFDQRLVQPTPKALSLTIKSELQGHYFGRALYLPTTTPLLHTSLRPAVIASTPPNPIPQSLTGASRGAIEGVYVPTILSSLFSQESG